MATPDVLRREDDLLSSPLLRPRKEESTKLRELSVEKKIEFLESLTGPVSNRRSRRWLNDRLLMELVPRLNEKEIRGLFTPPPWGDDVPVSPFCMTNGAEWDKFRTIDMDKEANIIHGLNLSTTKMKGHVDVDKMAVLNAWRRVDCRTREALRRSFLPKLIQGYENCVRAFIEDSGDGDVLVLQVQDPFHRLLLHGVCEVDAFTDTPFKGNPAAVCLLEEEKDEKWLQAVAAEFNISETCYLTRINIDSSNPRFKLRWFTPVSEVDLCGHATLAAAHTLFAKGLINSNIIEFVTRSGILTAKKIQDSESTEVSECQNGEVQGSFLIELDFPTVPTFEFNSAEVSTISQALGGASVIEIKRGTTASDNLLVVLPSGKAVAELQPRFDEILKCPGGGIIVTGAAPPDSGFDFYSRFFAPIYGVNEDPVCGSAHCALAPYWREKLGKCDFLAYQASPRSGILNIHLNEQDQRVLLRGKAVTVMDGCLLV
ncbi:PhzC-PhzF domain-containing protein/R3H-assoc domain-containing protein [Cephalotus follicularis]|uniref:PhzC-PhzF domain-containing protein/R3H-assoc domain-containing protein n=1 Tax=Cephalotus follicularis TaxID=3775 RepID=A0A1Q3CR54_CEPFO|nr:PhzC-PhzF domain-containing protein/R3H-assoc domain-containing protein [Cephalotus follicularis]